jgi:hypothetical protein
MDVFIDYFEDDQNSSGTFFLNMNIFVSVAIFVFMCCFLLKFGVCEILVFEKKSL